jgi:hypothetical protein
MQALLAASTVLLAAGAAGMAWAAVTEDAWPLLAPAGLLVVTLAYLVMMFVRLPGACAVVSERELHVRFPGAVDAAVPRSNVVAAGIANHRWWQGLGIRTDLAGTVMLATATGASAQFELAEPLRVWVIPRILPIRAKRLRLSVRDPGRLIAHFAPSAPADHQES